MNPARLRQLQSLQNSAEQQSTDQPLPDTAEKIQISSLSLLKMLKHGTLVIKFCKNILLLTL